MAKKTTKQVKTTELEEQNKDLKQKVRELTEEITQLKANNQEINVEELKNLAVNVRFCKDEGIFLLDKIAYSENGIATLVSSEPVAPEGFGDKVEHAYTRLSKYMALELKPKLLKEKR